MKYLYYIHYTLSKIHYTFPKDLENMDEIALPKDVANIMDTCLDAINDNKLPYYIKIRYGIIIINDDINQFLLNPYVKEGNFIERLHPDIQVTNLTPEEYKEFLENGGKDNFFDIMHEIECRIYINSFGVKSFENYSDTNCNILSINSKKNSIAGLIELYEFMKKLKEDNRIPQDATIGPVYYMY